MTLVKFIEATADYFKYSYETGATLVHQFIELFQNNNAVLGELADELWAPGLEVTVVNKIYKSPNLQAGTLIKCTQIGTTGTTEPDWSTVGAVGSTVTDGGVIWSVIPQTGQEIATQDEVTAGTVANKVVTPATAAGCYLRIWQGTTAPTDLSGRSAWLNTNTDPAALYYYNVSKSAWQSAVAYAAGAGTAANANYATSAGKADNSDYVKVQETPVSSSSADTGTLWASKNLTATQFGSNVLLDQPTQYAKMLSVGGGDNGAMQLLGNYDGQGKLFFRGIMTRSSGLETSGWRVVLVCNADGSVTLPSGVILK